MWPWRWLVYFFCKIWEKLVLNIRIKGQGDLSKVNISNLPGSFISLVNKDILPWKRILGHGLEVNNHIERIASKDGNVDRPREGIK